MHEKQDNMINDIIQTCLVPYDSHSPLPFTLQRYHPNYVSWKFSLGKLDVDAFDNDASYLMCAHGRIIKIKWLKGNFFLALNIASYQVSDYKRLGPL